MELVFDIETDDLDASQINCIVAIDEENIVYSFDIIDDNINEGISLLSKADKLIGHNILGFDIPVIHKLTGVDLYDEDKIIDTLVLSRLFSPTREGGHSLGKWGIKLGLPKSEKPEDFKKYDKEVLKYCINDVKVNKRLFNHLKNEAVGFSKESSLMSRLNSLLKQTEEEVHKTFKPKETIQDLSRKYTKSGAISKMGHDILANKSVRLTPEEYNKFKSGSKFVSRKLIQEFNLGSRKQIGEYLKEFGWKPKKFTPTGQPIVDEGTLKKITHIKEAKLIADFLLYQKRIAQVHSWLEAVADDGRVHGSVISTGAITGRMSARNPNLQQVPSINSPFGEDCRKCWVVDEGNKLVGIDASGLELRMLAHYMANKEYINEIIYGDIHTANQKLAGLESRDKAKTFIYAIIFGAGDKRIAEIIGGSTREAKKLRESFISSLPSFGHLRNRVKGASAKGFLRGLDGRKISLRYMHSALNTLLQGAGAAIMKKGLTIFYNDLKKENIPVKFVGNIHDEWQIEVSEKYADKVGQLGVKAIEKAGEKYNVKCPLTGEYKIGVSWNETH
jgi:DNA polymerase I-like protein with 3'-5' exonuclease and polymerase domains